VIDEESVINLRPGMNIYSCLTVRLFRIIRASSGKSS
jgi:hypothetical protein